tara:strand:- start:1336 stop:1875 length:540 start_codon:yes stop_codon:yes gene_type:complete
MTHEEILASLSEEDEKPSKLKKVYIFLVGTFLALLMFSFIFVSFPIDNILASRLESTPLIDNILEIEELKITFQDNTYETLRNLYLEEQSVEFSACLQGELIDNNYIITSLYQPEMYQQSFNHVSFEPCQNTLILLHTHPYKSCLASSTDLNTLSETQKSNPETIMLIMCEPERFSIYK